MELLLALIKPFVSHPERALFIAGLFFLILVVGLMLRREKSVFTLTPLAVATVAWLLFAMMEIHARSNGWNIRVDLLFTGPVLIVTSLFAVVHVVRKGVVLLSK